MFCIKFLIAFQLHVLGEGLDIFATLLHQANFPFLSVNYDFSSVELKNNTPTIETVPDASKCEDAVGKVAKRYALCPCSSCVLNEAHDSFANSIAVTTIMGPFELV